MCITAYRELSTLFNTNLHHRRLRPDNIQHILHNLERIFPMNLLPILESLNHIIYEFLCHVLVQSHTVIRILDGNRIDIEILKRRSWLGHLDSFLKVHSAHQLFALRQSQFCGLIVRFPFNDGFEVFEGSARVQNGSVGQCSSPVCLYPGSEIQTSYGRMRDSLYLHVRRVKFEGLGRIGNGISVSLHFDVSLLRYSVLARIFS